MSHLTKDDLDRIKRNATSSAAIYCEVSNRDVLNLLAQLERVTKENEALRAYDAARGGDYWTVAEKPTGEHTRWVMLWVRAECEWQYAMTCDASDVWLLQIRDADGDRTMITKRPDDIWRELPPAPVDGVGK